VSSIHFIVQILKKVIITTHKSLLSLVVVNNTPVSQTDRNKCLGVQIIVSSVPSTNYVQIDEKLTWDSHIDMIVRKLVWGIGAMRSNRPYCSFEFT